MGQHYALEIMSAVTGEPVETLIREALDRHPGNVAAAAEFLHISRQALYARLNAFPDLKRSSVRPYKQRSDRLATTG